jgi:hypothetical protein
MAGHIRTFMCVCLSFTTLSIPRHDVEVGGQLHAPVILSLRMHVFVYWVEGRVGPRTGLDLVAEKEICALTESNPDCPPHM